MSQIPTADVKHAPSSSDSFNISSNSSEANFNNSSVKLKTNSPETQKLTESQGKFKFGKNKKDLGSKKTAIEEEASLNETVRNATFMKDLGKKLSAEGDGGLMTSLKTSIAQSQNKSKAAISFGEYTKAAQDAEQKYNAANHTVAWENLDEGIKEKLTLQELNPSTKTSKQESAATLIRDEGNITSVLESEGLGRALTGEYAVFAKVVERMVPANDLIRDQGNNIIGIRYHGAIISLQDGKGFTAYGSEGSGLKPDDLRNITKQFLTELNDKRDSLIKSASISNNTGVGASAVSATADVNSSTAPDGSDTVDQAFADELKKMEINPDEGSLRYDGKKIGTFPVPLKAGQVAKTYKYEGNRLIPGDTNSNRQKIVKNSWTINTGGLRDWAKGKVDSKTAEKLVYHSLAFENNDGLRTSLKELNISKPALLVNLMAANSLVLNDPKTANEIIDLYGLVSGQSYENSSDERDALVSFITSTTPDDIGDGGEIDDDNEDSNTDLNDDPDDPNNKGLQGAGGNKPTPKPEPNIPSNTPQGTGGVGGNSSQISKQPASHKSDTNGGPIGDDTLPPSDIKGKGVGGNTDSDSGSASGIGEKKNKNKPKNQGLSGLSDDIFESDDGGQDDKKVKNRKLNNKQPEPEEHKEISGPSRQPGPLPPSDDHTGDSKLEDDSISVGSAKAKRKPKQTNKTNKKQPVRNIESVQDKWNGELSIDRQKAVLMYGRDVAHTDTSHIKIFLKGGDGKEYSIKVNSDEINQEKYIIYADDKNSKTQKQVTLTKEEWNELSSYFYGENKGKKGQYQKSYLTKFGDLAEIPDQSVLKKYGFIVRHQLSEDDKGSTDERKGALFDPNPKMYTRGSLEDDTLQIWVRTFEETDIQKGQEIGVPEELLRQAHNSQDGGLWVPIKKEAYDAVFPPKKGVKDTKPVDTQPSTKAQTNKTKNTSAVEDVKLPERPGHNTRVLRGMEALEFLGELNTHPFTESCDFTITGGKFKTQEELGSLAIRNGRDGHDYATEFADKSITNVDKDSLISALGLGRDGNIFHGSAAHNYEVDGGGIDDIHCNGINPNYFSELPTITYDKVGDQGGKHKDYENDIAKGAVWDFSTQQWMDPNPPEGYLGFFHKEEDRDAFEIVYLDLESSEDLDPQADKSNDDDSIKPTNPSSAEPHPAKRKRTPKDGKDDDNIELNKSTTSENLLASTSKIEVQAKEHSDRESVMKNLRHSIERGIEGNMKTHYNMTDRTGKFVSITVDKYDNIVDRKIPQKYRGDFYGYLETNKGKKIENNDTHTGKMPRRDALKAVYEKNGWKVLYNDTDNKYDGKHKRDSVFYNIELGAFVRKVPGDDNSIYVFHQGREDNGVQTDEYTRHWMKVPLDTCRDAIRQFGGYNTESEKKAAVEFFDKNLKDM